MSHLRAPPLILRSTEDACDERDHLQCRRHGFDPWVRKIPWRRTWQPTPVCLPGKSHKQRSLVGYSPRSHKELGMTEQLNNSSSKALRLNVIKEAPHVGTKL